MTLKRRAFLDVIFARKNTPNTQNTVGSQVVNTTKACAYISDEHGIKKTTFRQRGKEA